MMGTQELSELCKSIVINLSQLWHAVILVVNHHSAELVYHKRTPTKTNALLTEERRSLVCELLPYVYHDKDRQQQQQAYQRHDEIE
jgi:hypothetical protein